MSTVPPSFDVQGICTLSGGTSVEPCTTLFLLLSFNGETSHPNNLNLGSFLPFLSVVCSDPSRRFCAAHREAGMVDVAGRLCQHPGCVIHPSFAAESETFARFCVSHKEEGMVSAASHLLWAELLRAPDSSLCQGDRQLGELSDWGVLGQKWKMPGFTPTSFFFFFCAGCGLRCAHQPVHLPCVGVGSGPRGISDPAGITRPAQAHVLSLLEGFRDWSQST